MTQKVELRTKSGPVVDDASRGGSLDVVLWVQRLEN